MKIPVRTVGAALLILWLFLIGFAVSVVYSIKDIQLSIGEMQINVTAQNEVLFSLPMTIFNKGYYSLESFNISTEILSGQGSRITHAVTFIPAIGEGEAVNITEEIELNLTDMLRIYQSFLFNDTELQVSRTVSMSVAEIIPVQVAANSSLPWGAPLCNFRIGKPEIIEYGGVGSTVYSKVVVPMSFENHAFFDFDGLVKVRMYNTANALSGDGETAVAVPQHSSFNGNVELEIVPERVTRTGYFEVFFESSFFSFGPLVIPYEG
jgi:hypothetical protein